MSNSAPKTGLNSNRLIVHPNAPIVEIKIIIDNRYEPAEIAIVNTHTMPGSVVQGLFLDAAVNINRMWQQAEVGLAAKPPDLPPAPPLENPS